MDMPNAQITMIRQILIAAEHDPRIVGVVDYGSGSEGRMDAWSDVDAALFVRDADFDAGVSCAPRLRPRTVGSGPNN